MLVELSCGRELKTYWFICSIKECLVMKGKGNSSMLLMLYYFCDVFVFALHVPCVRLCDTKLNTSSFFSFDVCVQPYDNFIASWITTSNASLLLFT